MATGRRTAGDSDGLWDAVARGDTKAVRRLIKQGVELNHADRKGNLLLDVALSKGHLEIAEILRHAGAKGRYDMLQQMKVWSLLQAPYGRAVADGQEKVVRLLEAAGANDWRNMDDKLARNILEQLGIEVPGPDRGFLLIKDLLWEIDEDLRKPLHKRLGIGFLVLAVLTATPFVLQKVVPNAFANSPIRPSGYAIIAFLCSGLYIGWTWRAIASLPGSRMRRAEDKDGREMEKRQQQMKKRVENLVRSGFNEFMYDGEGAGWVHCDCGEHLLKRTGKKLEKKEADGTPFTMHSFICAACGKEFFAAGKYFHVKWARS